MSYVDKLVIEKWRDYPLNKPFPHHLRSLRISNANPHRFDNRILGLANLSVLSREKSRILSVPKAVECLHLTCPLPEVKCDGDLAECIEGLCSGQQPSLFGLVGERIAWLPEDFWNLENLKSLLITSNWSDVMSTDHHAGD